MKKFIFILLICISSLYSFDKVSLEYGASANDIDLYGISVVKDIDYKLLDNTNLSWEFALEHVDGKRDNMQIFSTQPMINYFLTKKIYFELGLGVAYFTEKNLDEKEYGMHFQFKENAGFGYVINDNFDITLKYSHYSNADMNSKNSGVDIIGARLVYKF